MFLKAVILGAGMAGYLARGLEFGKRVDALMSSELRWWHQRNKSSWVPLKFHCSVLNKYLDKVQPHQKWQVLCRVTRCCSVLVATDGSPKKKKIAVTNYVSTVHIAGEPFKISPRVVVWCFVINKSAYFQFVCFFRCISVVTIICRLLPPGTCRADLCKVFKTQRPIKCVCVRETESEGACVCVYMCAPLGCHGHLYQRCWVHYASPRTRPRLWSRPARLLAPWLSCDLADILIGKSEEW